MRCHTTVKRREALLKSPIISILYILNLETIVTADFRPRFRMHKNTDKNVTSLCKQLGRQRHVGGIDIGICNESAEDVSGTCALV